MKIRKLLRRYGIGRAKAPKQVEVTATFGTMMAFKHDLITDQILEFGAHTRPELAFLLSMLDPGDRVFDVGAHIGTFAIPIARKVGPSGRVLAVEGDAANFKLLRQNIARNGLTDVVDARHALIAPSDSAYIASHVHNNTGGTFFLAHRGSRTVPQCTIDELAAEAFQPDVIKIDIEGMEAWALGHASIIAKQKPILYVEIAESLLTRYGASISSLDCILRNLNYRLFRNVGPRNARNDDFEAREIATLGDGGDFFDVLALPHTSPRLARLI
jgi:FkbM family methyltransferase